MGCHHVRMAFMPSQGEFCDNCWQAQIRYLEEEIRKLRRELQQAQIELGKRQEINE